MMELSLDFQQLWLKSEHLHADPRRAHFHEHEENPMFISWSDRFTVLYPLGGLAEASLWNPVEPVILPTINPVVSVLTFDSKVYCIDEIGSVYHLKHLQRDSPDIFDFSPPSQISQPPLFNDYEWKVLYTQLSYPCNTLGATYYSDGIALVVTLDEWIIIQLLKITINDKNEPIIFNTCNKQIRPVKQFPFLVTSFVSCSWRDWFNSQRTKELFEPNALDGKDVFILGTGESKVYCATSNVISKNASLFLDSPQKIVHIQFCDFESKKLLLVSSSGILTVINCVENIPLSLIYLTVTKVVSVYIFDHTVVVSDGDHLFQITLDKQFSKVVRQVISPLTGVFSLKKFQFSKIIAMTQINKVYKLSPKYNVISQETELKFKFNENSILEDIKNLCKDIELLEEQHTKIDKYIDAVSIVARKDLIVQCCSLNVLIYSDHKAMKLGALHDEYIVAIKLSTDCSWLSFPSVVWQLLVRVIDGANTMSNCGLHSFDTNLFDSRHPLVIKHRVLASVIKNCSSGSVSCELVCQIKNDFVNRCLVVPLSPIKLNALYFVKAEKQEKIAVINPLENRHKYVFKFPKYLTLSECLTILINKNKHRMSKSLLTNIVDNLPKTLYMNFFGNIVTIILDDKTTKAIAMECVDQEALIAVRNGILDELSNNEPAIINYSVLADVQKQLCSIEEFSMKEQYNENIVKQIITQIQNQISIHLPV